MFKIVTLYKNIESILNRNNKTIKIPSEYFIYKCKGIASYLIINNLIFLLINKFI
jgi:hypothetical protein